MYYSTIAGVESMRTHSFPTLNFASLATYHASSLQVLRTKRLQSGVS